MNTIAATAELEAASDEFEAELFAFAEREDGPGQRAAKEQLVKLLATRMGLTRKQTLAVVADAGRQTDVNGQKLTSRANGRANGRQVKPEPDFAYNAQVRGAPLHVNVEADTNPEALRKHIEELKYADPNGRHVGLIVHPVTGVTVAGMVWDPRPTKKGAPRGARRLSSSEIAALQNGRLPRSLIPVPSRKQTNRAVPPRKVRSVESIDKVLNAAVKNLRKKPAPQPRRKPAPVRGKAGAPRKKKGSRESEMEFAASELEWALGHERGEQIEIDVPGIPGHNQWFTNPGEARRAALRAATSAGAGYTIAHDPRPSRGQPHYHVVGPGGARVSGHFFYGRRPPRRILRGRPNRESEFEFTARDFEFELAGG